MTNLGKDDKNRKRDPFFDFIMSILNMVNNTMREFMADEAKTLQPHTTYAVEEEKNPSTVIEDGKFIRVYIDIPGISRDSLDIYIEGGEIIITGSRYGVLIKKSIRIPPKARKEIASTSYNNGVLEIVLRKK